MSTESTTQAAEQVSANEPRVTQFVDPTSAPAIDPAPASSVKLFNRSNQFRRAILNPDTPDGKKRCLVRFPTDEEWCSRAKQTVSVRKSLDMGRSKTETPRETEISAALFAKIRLDPDGTGPEFDDAEAARVIDRLETCTPESCDRLGVVYTIRMRTFNDCEVVHELKMPSQKQMMDFGRAAIQITSQRQTLETRIALEPARTLWEALKVSVSGYEGTVPACVPIIHMSAALNELLAQVNADAEAMDRDPEL